MQNEANNIYQLIHVIHRFEPLAFWRENKLLLVFPRKQILRINRWKNTKMFADIRKLIIVIRPIEKPGAWICINGTFKPIIPEFDIFSLYSKSQIRFKNYLENPSGNGDYFPRAYLKTIVSWQLFYGSIPEKYLKIIKKYDQSYWWRLLQLLNRQRQTALDLELSTPALFIMLGHMESFKNTTHKWRTMNSLIHKKQYEILDYLGFPGSKSMVKILRKCPHSMLEIKSLIHLRKILACQPNLKILQHVKKINTFLLIILGQPDWKDYFSFNFLSDISNSIQSDKERHYDLYFTIKDTISMLQDLRVYEPARQIRIRSLKNLNDVHDFAIQKLYENKSEQIERIQFHQAFSFNTPSWLTPICDTIKLFEEGSVMNHCIYTYQEAILHGECAAFSVKTETERATLLIKKDFNQQWRIVDIRKRFNEKVSNDLYNRILRWIEKENKKNCLKSRVYDQEADTCFAVVDFF